jgi:2'-5' RNA ligase
MKPMSRFIFPNQLLFQTLGREALLRSNVVCDELLLVIQPSEEIGTHLWRGKQYLIPHLPGNRSVYSKAHFTVGSILAPCFLHGRLLQAVEAACMQITKLIIGMDGYGKFENGDGRNVIFLQPEQLFFSHLQLLLRRALRQEGLRFKSAIFPEHAHLTLVKDLFNAQLQFWWPQIGPRPYHGHFQAAELVVLQREPVPYSKCEVMARIPFTGKEPLPASWGLKPRQGNLFQLPA